MDKKLRRGGVALLLAVASITLTSASSSATSRSSVSDDRDVQVLHLTAVAVSEAFLDLDGSGGQDVTIGDQFMFSSDLFRGSKKIGFDGGFCTLVRLPALLECVGTNSLPGGQLTAQGLLDYGPDFDSEGPFHLAITGGTGRYKTAHGEVRVIDRLPPERDSLTFRIIR
jgi:allene oxide cyclase-like protein